MLNPFSSAEHRVRPRWNGSLSFAQGQLGSAWRARRDRKRVNSIHDVCIAQQSLASIFSRCAKASPLNSPDSIEPPDHDCGNEHGKEVSGEGAPNNRCISATSARLPIVTPQQAGRFEARSFLYVDAHKKGAKSTFHYAASAVLSVALIWCIPNTFQNTAYSSICMISSRIPCAFLKSSTARLQ